LSLEYQPQININTGEIIGVEALSRWRHPVLGQIPPIEFISLAEKIGMIKPLTDWVLSTACRQLIAWKDSGIPDLKMAVNISPSLFLDKDIVSFVQKIINETGISPAVLELEVTESVTQTDDDNLKMFKDLKNLGISLAIDDFGTGYSSFSSLKHLNVDYLKIDRYFIDDMLADGGTRLLVGSMIEMGHNLGHEIIAEGIETQEQLEILKSLGCETGQGYLFSKPVTAEKVSNLIRSV